MNAPILLTVVLSCSARVSCAKYPPTAACPHPIALEHGIGCYCTAASCGKWNDLPRPLSPAAAVLLTTSPDDGFMKHETLRVQQSASAAIHDESDSPRMLLSVLPKRAHQQIVGFGAAVTDAVGHCLMTLLEPAAAAELLRQAFVHANLSMSRVPLGSSDFSRMNYALSHSPDVSDWCLRDDRSSAGSCGRDYKLTVLQQVSVLQPSLRLLVSAWSAPPEYKHRNYEEAQTRDQTRWRISTSRVCSLRCYRYAPTSSLFEPSGGG